MSTPTIALSLACLLWAASTSLAQAEAEKLNIMQTPSGIHFGVYGAKPSSPAPTLFVFARNVEDALGSPTYNKVGMILAKHGYISVALDSPYHRGPSSPPSPGDTWELEGWATVIKKGDSIFPEFASKVSQVLDFLIKEGYTDPQKVAVVGTSRGGFLAMHVAAADPRFKCAMAFVPVADLTDLTEFAGMQDNALAKSLALVNVADKLVGRPVWVAIGNNDYRVNTDRAIEFTRKIVAASIAKNHPTDADTIDVELHVMPWPGHGGDQRWDGRPNSLNAHDAAAAWLLSRMGEPILPEAK
jgi:dienelactone hydrolase